MSDGNGADIGAVYQLLTEVAHTVAGHDRKLDGLAARLDAHDRKLDELTAGLGELREAVTHYHATVLGHGVLISELDERVRRIERHLKLEPSGD